MSDNAFNMALGNFINDFACGGAIRSLSEKGFTIGEIKERLDYPVSRDKIAQIVWRYYLEEGIVLVNKPETTFEKARFVQDTDKYGRKTMRKVVENVQNPSEYVACELGKKIYKDKKTIVSVLEAKDKRLSEHLLLLPWPLETVYIDKNYNMFSILIS